MARADAPHDLLFGLLALQNGMVNQSQLVAAFGAWTLAQDRPLADVLVEQHALDVAHRTLLEALVAAHLKLHGDDPEKTLASLPAGRSTRHPLPPLPATACAGSRPTTPRPPAPVPPPSARPRPPASVSASCAPTPRGAGAPSSSPWPASCTARWR